MTHWTDEYPHKVNASVLLLDGEIYNWKVGNQYWEHPEMIRMRISDMPLMREERFTVENKSFVVNNDFEHNLAFDFHAKQWFKNWKISDKHIGGKCY